MNKFWKHREALHTIARFSGLDLQAVVHNLLGAKQWEAAK
jgi:hypothetical protein